MNPLDFDGVILLLMAIFKRARLDARKGDRAAARFLQYFGAPVPNRRNVKGI
jgi:hypothetical protein